jgi:hypothetical protein
LSWLAALSGEFGAQAVEGDGLRGAAGGVVLGVEVDYDRLAFKVLQMRLAVAVGRQLEVRRHVAVNQFLNHIALVSSHYGANARLLERDLVFGHCLAGRLFHSAEQTTQTSSRLAAFESTKIALTLLAPRRMIGIGR